MISNYRRTMQKTELLLCEETVMEGPGFYEKMFLHNRIPGILPFTTEQSGEQIQYCYDIGAKYSLTEMLSHTKMDHVQMEWLIRNLIKIIDGGREYLIDEKDYVINPEFIFRSGEGEQLYLCCYPLRNKNVRQQMTELFEYLLSRIDYQDIEAVGMAYELYMKSKEPGYRFVDLLRILDLHMDKEELLIQEAEPDEEISPEAELQRETPENCFDEDAEKNPEAMDGNGYCLKGEQLRDLIEMIQFPFYIGQIEDGTIGRIERPVIGKTYAKISIRGACVYIEDMKSENGIFVNGRRIAGNEIHKLNLGDSVMLADRSYRFMRTS